MAFAHDNYHCFREDELRHLEFISDVTNDVLDRGIFSNRYATSVLGCNGSLRHCIRYKINN